MTPDNPNVYHEIAPYIEGMPINDSGVARRIIKFDLPFLILISDSFQETKDGICFTAINESYKVNVLNNGVILRFLKKTAYPIDSPDLHYAHKREFYGNVSKNTSYTTVIAEIENADSKRLFHANELPEQQRILQYELNLEINVALDALNKFINIYKIQNTKYYIPKITSHSIGEFLITEQYNDKNCQTFYTIRHFDAPIPFENTIGPEAEKKIQELLDAEQQNYLHELFAELWYKLHMQNWRSAIIDSAVLFEAWLTPFLKSIYVSKGLNRGQVKLKFKTGESKFPMGIYEICQTLIADATNYLFQDTENFQNLITNTINVRNKLVHGTLLSATKEQAYASMNSVIVAVDTINSFAALRIATSAIDAGTLVVTEAGIDVVIPDFPFPDASNFETHLSIPSKKYVLKRMPNGKIGVTMIGFKEFSGYGRQ